MNNTVVIIGKENQYEYQCGSCGVTAYGHKGRCVCDDCKIYRDECEVADANEHLSEFLNKERHEHS